MWARHHRVFWLFHETHHLYEAEFQDRFDFAELIKKTDHPMFQYDNWMEEFKGLGASRLEVLLGGVSSIKEYNSQSKRQYFP